MMMEETTYDIPWFLSTVDIIEHFLQCGSLHCFTPLERFHAIFLHFILVLFFISFAPPPSMFKEFAEPRNRVVDSLAVFYFLTGTIRKGVI